MLRSSAAKLLGFAKLLTIFDCFAAGTENGGAGYAHRAD